jgi:hypothetical protein
MKSNNKNFFHKKNNQNKKLTLINLKYKLIY